MADKERRFFSVMLVGDALLLLCALLGLTGSFLSLYGNPDALQAADTVLSQSATALDRAAADGDLLMMYAALFALLSLAVFSLPRLWGAAAGALAALWAGAVLLCWTQVIQGAGLVVRLISVQFSQRVDWGHEFLYDPGLTFVEECNAVRLFLILALAGLGLLLGWAVVRARCWWLTLEFTLPFLLPGLLADLYPDWPAFMALAACWCAMLLCDLCKWAAPSGRGWLTLVVLPCVAALLMVITLAFPQEGYTRPAWALKAQEDLMNLTSHMSDYFSHWDGPFQNTVTYVGAAEEADLAHAGPLSYSGRTVLRFTSDYDGRLYLRGSSLAVYEEGVWKALPEGTYQSWRDALEVPPKFPLTLPSQLLSSEVLAKHTITIENVGAVGACVYAPYFLNNQNWEAAGMLPVEDTYLARKQGQWTHTVSFVDIQLYEVGVGYYHTYNDFVYAHYLDVPEQLWDGLNEIRWLIGQSSFAGSRSPNPVVQQAEEVAQYLDTLCEYDINAPAAPDGTDPVLYFLTESYRGYCMHYASAAALILRTMGIPARYVSGFTAESVPKQQQAVPDRAAHAWVEVWVDGFGWHPVEVTPAAAFTWYEQGNTVIDDRPSIPPEETDEPEPTPTPTAAPDTTLLPSAAPGEPSGDDPGGPGFTVPSWLVKALAAVFGAATLLWLGQLLPKRYRDRQLSGPDPNRAALYAYACLERIKRWGGQVDERAVELAQKAKFSQHTLTHGELAELRGFFDRERERLCAVLSPAGRVLFIYLWGMPASFKKRENTEKSDGNRD